MRHHRNYIIFFSKTADDSEISVKIAPFMLLPHFQIDRWKITLKEIGMYGTDHKAM